MAEFILSELKKRLWKRKVGIFIDEKTLHSLNKEILTKIISRYRELGTVKIALCLCEETPSDKLYQNIIGAGFNLKIVPKDTMDMSFLLETYDNTLFHEIEIVVLGTSQDSMLPLITEVRKHADIVFALITDEVSDSFKNSVDQVLTIEDIEKSNGIGNGIDMDLEPHVDVDRQELTGGENHEADIIFMEPVSEIMEKEEN